jgi:hypothetical protein
MDEFDRVSNLSRKRSIKKPLPKASRKIAL